MSSLFCHTGPHLILFRTTSITEQQISHYDKEDEDKYLHYREITNDTKQVGTSVIDICLLTIEIIKFYRHIFRTHDFQLLFHIIAVVHHGRIEVAIAEDLILRLVKYDDRNADSIIRHIIYKQGEHIIKNSPQFCIDKRLVIVQKRLLAVNVYLYRRVNVKFHLHFVVEDFLILKFLRKVYGKRDIIFTIRNNDRNANVTLDYIQIDHDVFIVFCGQKTTIRHGEKLHSFAFLQTDLIKKAFGIIHQFCVRLNSFRPHRHLLLLLHRKFLDQVISIIHRKTYDQQCDYRQYDLPSFFLYI